MGSGPRKGSVLSPGLGSSYTGALAELHTCERVTHSVILTLPSIQTMQCTKWLHYGDFSSTYELKEKTSATLMLNVKTQAAACSDSVIHGFQKCPIPNTLEEHEQGEPAARTRWPKLRDARRQSKDAQVERRKQLALDTSTGGKHHFHTHTFHAI